MYALYTWSKYLHIVTATIWIGGVLALNVLDARLAREKDRMAQAALLRQSDFYGMAILAPAGFVSLLTGVTMTALGGLGVPFWIAWGLVGIFASSMLGAVFVRRTARKLAGCILSGSELAQVSALQRRMMALSGANLLLLSVVWAMVFKPTL